MCRVEGCAHAEHRHRRSLPITADHTCVYAWPLHLPQRYEAILEWNSANPAKVVNRVALNVFLVIATATRGQDGSPDIIARQRIVRITTP